MKNKEVKKFIDYKIESMDIIGFWDEVHRCSVIKSLELYYRTEIIREYFIQDMLPNGDKFLIKWQKRFEPLTEEELKDDYGR